MKLTQVQSRVLILILNKDYETTEEIPEKSHRVIKLMRKTPAGKRFESTCDQKEDGKVFGDGSGG